MKCVAVCKEQLLARTLHRALAPSLEVEFILEDRTVVRRLHEAGLNVHVADPRTVDCYVKADVSPATIVIVEDTGKRSLRPILRATVEAGAALVYVLSTREESRTDRAEKWKNEFPEFTSLSLGDLLRGSLLNELGRSLTRARVQQYQRHFTDADRVLILLHNDPDPDAMASGLALRNLLHRTKTTAIIGAFKGASRPENIRMANLLDIKVKLVTTESLTHFDRIATVDVQPGYFGSLLQRVDLVVDHHPEQIGYTATFKDIRADYGSTSTILTEHLRAVDASISERVATAMLYAIKSDTLFLSRQTNRLDLEAFSYLYPLANATLVRKMEGTEITQERLAYITRAGQVGRNREQVFTAHLGTVPREDLIPYVTDFLLQVEDVEWSIVSGIVNDAIIISVRNLGYSRNASDFVKGQFSDIGNAGGHRAMAKAVIPKAAFHRKFGSLDDDHISRLLRDLADGFLMEHTGATLRRDNLHLETTRLRGRLIRQGERPSSSSRSSE